MLQVPGESTYSFCLSSYPNVCGGGAVKNFLREEFTMKKQ